MSRRPSRSGRRGPFTTRSLSARVEALFAAAGGSIFRASRYAVDGVSGKVASFVDLVDPTHVLAQATGAAQTALPAANGAAGNALTAPFAGTQYYASSRAPSAWKKLHDGTGVEIVAVFVAGADAGTEKVVWSTGVDASIYTSVQVGAYHQYRSGASGDFGWFASNGAARILTGAGNIATTVTAGAGIYSDLSYVEGAAAAQEWIARNKSATIFNGDSIAAPSAADPAATLTLGANSTGTNGGTFGFHSLWFLPRVMTAAERTLFQQMIQAETGIMP